MRVIEIGVAPDMVYTQNALILTDLIISSGGSREGVNGLRKILIMLVITALAASLSVIAGCGGGSGDGEAVENGRRVIEDEQRKITVEEPEGEEDSGKVTIEGEQGEQATIEVQGQAPSEEALGASIYPGADYIEGSGVSGTTTSGDKELTASGAEFTTGDAIGKVIDWYKGKLGEPLVNMPEEATWMIQNQDGSITTVIVAIFEGETKITIAKIGGDIDIRL
jgi:hypothetical protein